MSFPTPPTTTNNFPSSNGLGLPGSGFGSRRANGSHIKRLSFEPARPSDAPDNGAPTPRTSRSHLLAGLRTAPKSATSSSFPATAPPTQLQHPPVGLPPAGLYADPEAYGGAGPKTSHALGPRGNGYGPPSRHDPMYPVPEQILAPPEILVDEHVQEQMDPNLYAQLVATNLYLAEQQQRLQQQLASVQAAAQQFQGVNMNMNMAMHPPPPFGTPPVTPQTMYQQQQQHQQHQHQQQVRANAQPIITPVMGQPGVYSHYNPLTGVQSYFLDPNQPFVEQQCMPPAASFSPLPPNGPPRFQVSPPTHAATPTYARSISPPKKASPPPDHAPLPPPSAGAFRRGHRKANSVINSIDVSASLDGPRSALLPKSMTFPATPAFGPGQARAGEHPVRQPRGPPSLDELLAKPTTKFEGSKNFATRARRTAVNNLVRAGISRRSPVSAASGSMSPVSEVGEMAFSASDNDSDSGRSACGSGSLSGRPSHGSPRTSLHGAIGSDRPSSRSKERSVERKSVASVSSGLSAASIAGEEGPGGSFAAAFKNGGKKPEASPVERKSSMLVLTSVAERRKSLLA